MEIINEEDEQISQLYSIYVLEIPFSKHTRTLNGSLMADQQVG